MEAIELVNKIYSKTKELKEEKGKKITIDELNKQWKSETTK
jgi:hypothetical protein